MIEPDYFDQYESFMIPRHHREQRNGRLMLLLPVAVLILFWAMSTL